MSDRPTLESLGAALAAGSLTPVQLVTEAVQRAHGAGAAFIEVFDRQAMAEAEQSAARWAVGNQLSAFDGIPFAVKDLFDVAGSVTTAGSKTRLSVPAALRDAPIVANLRRHGLIPVGKTNLSEFAFSGLGLNPHFGTPVPRERPDRAPGGSSSGSAVAIADDVVCVALGTDTAGSVRIPAAFNGLAGYRPSLGRYDQAGVFPLAASFDVAGPMANSVADCIAMDRMMGGKPGAPGIEAPFRLLVETSLLDHAELDPLHRALVLDFAERAARAGARVDMKPVAAMLKAGDLIRRVGWLGGVEAARLHRERLAGPERALIDPVVAKRLERAAAMPAGDIETLTNMRRQLIAEIAWEVGDAIVVKPTTLIAPPLLKPLVDDESLFIETNRQALFITMIGSYLDMPGVAIPQAATADGQPGSILLGGISGDDARVLAAAAWTATL